MEISLHYTKAPYFTLYHVWFQNKSESYDMLNYILFKYFKIVDTDWFQQRSDVN